MARQRKTNRKGTRPRIDTAELEGGWSKFTASDAQWSELEAVLGKPIPTSIRDKIGASTSNYMDHAQAEENAPDVVDYKHRLAEIREVSTRLRRLLFQTTDETSHLAAAIARAGLHPVAFDDSLLRVINNCRTEHRRASPGFIAHTAWDIWIAALGQILSDAALPHGIATPTYKRISPFVRFVDALQLLLPKVLRRHGGRPLTREMMAARKRTRNQTQATTAD
jgi:hypothetical protein